MCETTFKVWIRVKEYEQSPVYLSPENWEHLKTDIYNWYQTYLENYRENFNDNWDDSIENIELEYDNEEEDYFRIRVRYSGNMEHLPKVLNDLSCSSGTLLRDPSGDLNKYQTISDEDGTNYVFKIILI